MDGNRILHLQTYTEKPNKRRDQHEKRAMKRRCSSQKIELRNVDYFQDVYAIRALTTYVRK